MRILLLFALLTFFNDVHSQVPDFLGNNPEWYSEEPDDTQYPCLPKHYYTVYLNGEQTFGSYTYKKAFRHGVTNYTLFADPNQYPPGYCTGSDPIDQFEGYIRQDSLKFYTYISGQDSLLYDFDLQLGDTTPETSVFFSGGWIVTSIDSVLINGFYAKKFYLHNDLMSMTDSTFILQGVGCGGGLFYRFPGYFENDPKLVCYGQNGTTYYSDGQCNYSVGVEEVEANAVQAYPNPADETVFLSGLEENNLVQVFASDGRCVLRAAGKDQLDVRDLHDGVYQLRISTDVHESTQTLIIYHP